MHETAVKTMASLPRGLGAALGVLLLSGSLVMGQQPLGKGNPPPLELPPPNPPAKTAGKSLEDLLAAALKNNPDIRVAEAKVREAEAELNRARLQTTQKLVTLYRGLEAQKALVQSLAAETHQLELLQKSGAAPSSSVEPSRQKALQAKAKLSEIEAELAYLTGEQPAGSATERLAAELQRALHAQNVAVAHRALLEEDMKRATGVTKVQSAMAERLRKALDTDVTVAFPNTDLNRLVKLLEEQTGGIPIVMKLDGLPNINLSLSFSKPVRLGAALQALEDTASVRFIVRDYGLFLTGDRALPPGAVPLSDIWRGGAVQDLIKAPAAEPKK